ncbi:MAG: hypothetical protein L6R36_004102 [Xanthoria steineri]|nr:MAG: hypothetical protein L6R36_004102 [Xanthoria steineri]
MPALPPSYAIAHATPSVETYIALRTTTGLTPFSPEASARALPNSLFTVLIMHEGEAVGMGRIIGDGGCFFQVTDICTHPAHRGLGLAKAVMAELTTWLDGNAPRGAWVGCRRMGRQGGCIGSLGFGRRRRRLIVWGWRG